MKKECVVVTGLGVVTSNGQNVTDFFENCQAGQRGITDSPCSVFDTSKLLTPFWGQVTEKKDGRQSSHIFRAQALAEQAVDEALSDAGIDRRKLQEMGMRSALLLASLSYDDYHILEISTQQATTGRAQNLDSLSELSSLALHMKKYCGIAGACYDFSSACSSSTAAIGSAMELIRSGQCDIAVVCGVDALSKMVGYGFHSLKALSSQLCHPLDEERDGINIGEGCGVLVLESASHAEERHAKIYAECVGASTGNEAFHITSPDTTADGFFRSMEAALDDAGLPAESIDYVNLHGTGTPINDRIELSALNRLYETAGQRPYLSSLKTLIGHCMGAAGALEAIMTILCLHRQSYLPAFYVEHPMEELGGFSISPPEEGTAMHYALSNSFAFAGNTASVIFRHRGESDRDLPETDQKPVFPVWINGVGILTPRISDISQWKQELYSASTSVEENSDTEKEGTPNSLLYNGSTSVDCSSLPTPLPGISVRKLRGVNHLSRLVMSSALQAENDSGLDHTTWDAKRTGTYYSSEPGAITERLEYGKIVAEEHPELCNPTVFANISPNAPLGYLCMNLNCKGPSASFHGASALTPSVLSLQNGSCDTVLSCMAEEYEPLLAEARKAAYQESGVTLLLQNKKTACSYCRIEQIATCDLNSPDAMQTVSKSPDIIFAENSKTAPEAQQYQWLQKHYKAVPLLSVKDVTGPLAGDSLYAAVALAAVCLQKQKLPDILAEQNNLPQGFAVSTILVTGCDACLNYHQILLSTGED